MVPAMLGHPVLTPTQLIGAASEHGRVMRARAFGDFSKDPLAGQGRDLDTASIEKIQCTTEYREQYTAQQQHKNYTDFYMLDSIYQAAYNSDIQTFVLVTGDGHFASACAFLRHRLMRHVVVVGYGHSMSKKLRCGDWELRIVESDCPRLSDDQVLQLIRFVNVAMQEGKPISAKGTARVFKLPDFDEQSMLDEVVRLINEGLFVQVEGEYNGSARRLLKLDKEDPRVKKALGAQKVK